MPATYCKPIIVMIIMDNHYNCDRVSFFTNYKNNYGSYLFPQLPLSRPTPSLSSWLLSQKINLRDQQIKSWMIFFPKKFWIADGKYTEGGKQYKKRPDNDQRLKGSRLMRRKNCCNLACAPKMTMIGCCMWSGVFFNRFSRSAFF